MSRTFRKKNFEAENNTSWDTRGRKTAGFYTEVVWHFCNGSPWLTYVVPTPIQYNDRYWSNHGESRSRNVVSPGHEYRHMRMKQNRAITRQELHKFITIPD